MLLCFGRVAGLIATDLGCGSGGFPACSRFRNEDPIDMNLGLWFTV